MSWPGMFEMSCCGKTIPYIWFLWKRLQPAVSVSLYQMISLQQLLSACYGKLEPARQKQLCAACPVCWLQAAHITISLHSWRSSALVRTVPLQRVSSEIPQMIFYTPVTRHPVFGLCTIQQNQCKSVFFISQGPFNLSCNHQSFRGRRMFLYRDNSNT